MEENLWLGLLTLGIFITLVGVVNLTKALRRRSWPETIGRIQRNEATKVSRFINYRFNSGLLSWKTGRPIEDNGVDMRLRLSYVYVVGDYKYIGSQLYSAPIVKQKNRVFGVNEGDKIKVFYNPNNPQTAFLAHSLARPSTILIISGLLLCLSAILLSDVHPFITQVRETLLQALAELR